VKEPHLGYYVWSPTLPKCIASVSRPRAAQCLGIGFKHGAVSISCLGVQGLQGWNVTKFFSENLFFLKAW
jgi:hypothetical protein